ncbi:MAG: DUF3995 domain-containing protein [Desulfovibrionaceae bacterium]
MTAWDKTARAAGAIGATALLLIGLLHAYWGLGGGAWLTSVIPVMPDGSQHLPPPVASAGVALLILFGAYVLAGRCGLLPTPLPNWCHTAGTRIMALVFVVRSVGDFQVCGFFKTVTGTPFAALDTALFTPICVGLAVCCLLAERADKPRVNRHGHA